MQVRIFTIPISDTGAFAAEMNAFLLANKILEIEQKFFQNENGSHWSFCVRYIQNGVNTSGISGAYSNVKKIDYREVLSPECFAVFAKLRTIRKELAIADGVPAYAVFTDEELASIAKLPEITEKSVGEIKGIGEKKMIK